MLKTYLEIVIPWSVQGNFICWLLGNDFHFDPVSFKYEPEHKGIYCKRCGIFLDDFVSLGLVNTSPALYSRLLYWWWKLSDQLK